MMFGNIKEATEARSLFEPSDSVLRLATRHL